jgi:quinol monooxygenase YgiN
MDFHGKNDSNNVNTDNRRRRNMSLLFVSYVQPIPITHIHIRRNEMVKYALFARLEAKPGKENDVAKFLETGLALAQQESTTPIWFALRLGPTTFGIFDAFTDEAGRQAHLSGPIAQALMAKASELLSQAPSIEPIDVLGAKLPG